MLIWVFGSVVTIGVNWIFQSISSSSALLCSSCSPLLSEGGGSGCLSASCMHDDWP